MTCGHCEKAVNVALTDLVGIDKVEINLETGKVDQDKMIEAVEEQGYDAA